MKTKTLNLTIALWALAAFSIRATAETIYVDQRYGPGGDGTPNAPYDTIQAGINNGNSTVVIVYPGTYAERLSVNKSLILMGYDGPLTTRVDAAAGGNAVSMAQNITVTIQGLNLSSGTYGAYQPTAGTLYLRNCIVCGNTSHGIYVARTSDATCPNVFIDNCISVANGGSGLYIYGTRPGGDCNHIPNVRAFNTIFIGNQGYGVDLYVNGYNSSYGLCEGAIVLDYNDYVANADGNYGTFIGPGKLVSAGSHSFSLAPDFVGGSSYGCNQDFRLLPSSACRDAGQPGIGWLDPDGTRNDIGAYGGPGAQNFYTNPNDGPMIRSVTIDQGMVPRGSTFTIRATAGAR